MIPSFRLCEAHPFSDGQYDLADELPCEDFLRSVIDFLVSCGESRSSEQSTYPYLRLFLDDRVPN